MYKILCLFAGSEKIEDTFCDIDEAGIDVVYYGR
jgi:hypothetical protein